MLEKATGLGADMVVLDLEDAVAPSEKEAARANVVRAVNDLEWGDMLVCVRINAWDSQWARADAAIVKECGARLDEVMLPKAESGAQLAALDELLARHERSASRAEPVGLEVQIETPLGVLALADICTASDRLAALVFGPADFAAALQMPVLTGGAPLPDYPGDQFHYVLMQLLIAARAHGLQAVDGPFLAIDDSDGLRRSARRTHQLGFDGKWAIHPSQVAVVNEVFTPTADQVHRATALLDAYDAATADDGRGAVRFEGEMIDEASAKMARALVTRARRAGAAPA